MDDDKKTAICWELSRDREYNYFHLRLHVFVGVVEEVEDLIRGAVDRSRWSREEAAVRMEAWYRQVLAEGYTEVYDMPWSGNRPSFRLTWMEYDPGHGMDERSKGYTSHKVAQLGDDTYDGAMAGLELLRKVRQRVEKLFPQLGHGRHLLDDPKYVVSALEAMKDAVMVERLDRRSEDPMTIVRSRSRRMRLRTEGVVALFGR